MEGEVESGEGGISTSVAEGEPKGIRGGEGGGGGGHFR